MSRRPAAFTEADIRRACKAAPDRTVELVPDGTIRLVPSSQAPIRVTQSGAAKDAADVVEERLK